MGFFNYIGLIIVIVMLIPNIIYGIMCPNGFNNVYKNKIVIIFENISRYASFFLMIFNIPYTYFDFWFEHGFLIYMITNFSLLTLYLLFWIICWDKRKILRAYVLSIIPSIMFIISGVMIRSVLLFVFSIIFAYCHITISLKNAYLLER